ncbi:MAG: sulfite exporter TauE/SafE family protein [Gammaproteobacteria bacterium]|nr:sulfite exporter TauE/SafE family protein [Gammaproteobacteria bacterium]
MPLDLLLLFVAGVAGGMLNSLAGGGSFITFPALLMAGIPPISANATNTFASCSGYISGTYAFRQDLIAAKAQLPRFILISLVGGIIGAWLLLQTPEALFREAIPWLLLFATLLFIYGARLNNALSSLASRHRHASAVGRSMLVLLLLAVCIYGGFFNAGLGIIILSYLALSGQTNINTMNGLKLLVSTCVSLIAIALFIYDGVIAWYQGSIVLVGTLVGGYLAAHYSRQLPQSIVRQFVIIASIGITLYFFYDSYWPTS